LATICLATAVFLALNCGDRVSPGSAGPATEPTKPPPATATARGQPPATVAAAFATSAVYVVGNTGGDGVWLRRSPSMDDWLQAWVDGTPMTVVGPDQQADGKVWKNVKDPDGNVGWVPVEYLVGGPTTTKGTASPTPSPTPATPRELNTYQAGEITWKIILVSPGTTRDALITLAKATHSKDPFGYYRIFDDAQLQRFIDWDANYGKVYDVDGKIRDVDTCIDPEYCRSQLRQQDLPYPLPEAWANKHHIASIQRVPTGRTFTWQLVSGQGEKIADLQ
jgi:hypothetical protein